MMFRNTRREAGQPRMRRALAGLGLSVAMTITSGLAFTSAAHAAGDTDKGKAVGKIAYEQGVTSDSDSVIARRVARDGLCNYYTGFWFDNFNDRKFTYGGLTTSKASCDHVTSGYEYHNQVQAWTTVDWAGRNWCADFAKYAFYWGGADITYGFTSAGDISIGGVTQLTGLAASFRDYGRAHDTWHQGANYVPRRGDAVVYDWTGNGTIDHVGIVTSYYEDNLDGKHGSVEGNAGGGDGKIVHRTGVPNHDPTILGYTSPVG